MLNSPISVGDFGGGATTSSAWTLVWTAVATTAGVCENGLWNQRHVRTCKDIYGIFWDIMGNIFFHMYNITNFLYDLGYVWRWRIPRNGNFNRERDYSMNHEIGGCPIFRPTHFEMSQNWAPQKLDTTHKGFQFFTLVIFDLSSKGFLDSLLSRTVESTFRAIPPSYCSLHRIVTRKLMEKL